MALSPNDLLKLSQARYREAKLLVAQEPDGAVHVCGYALECLLKRKIVETLKWDSFPETNAEFGDLKYMKTHDLSALLRLSGIEKQLLSDVTMEAKWKIASSWDSEIRYQKIGTLSVSEAQGRLDATRDVLNFILHTK
jgi:hypothetical protein